MSEFKTLVLHGHYGSPNPGKVMVILKELELPYKVVRIKTHKWYIFVVPEWCLIRHYVI